jgi:hypothetical protein
VTYLLPPEFQSIDVQQDAQGHPVSIVWQGRSHVVEQISNTYRVDIGWWTQNHICRDYFMLTTQSGLFMIIYRDRLTGKWMLEQSYD